LRLSQVNGQTLSECDDPIERFVAYYNEERVHESLENLTPADVYHGRAREILTARARLKARTLRQRKCYNRGQIPRKEELIRPSLFREVSITNRPEMSHSL
jgi:hypothetical protein